MYGLFKNGIEVCRSYRQVHVEAAKAIAEEWETEGHGTYEVRKVAEDDVVSVDYPGGKRVEVSL